MQEVNFVKATIANYNKRNPAHDENNIYFIEDTNEVMIGDMKFGSAFITVDANNPLPATGRYGYLYIDKRTGFSIKVWDDINNAYVDLPIATSDYLKTVRRGEDDIIGVRGNGEEVSAKLDGALTTDDIDTLFPAD